MTYTGWQLRQLRQRWQVWQQSYYFSAKRGGTIHTSLLKHIPFVAV